MIIAAIRTENSILFRRSGKNGMASLGVDVRGRGFQPR
jgi:hypothetical protein